MPVDTQGDMEDFNCMVEDCASSDMLKFASGFGPAVLAQAQEASLLQRMPSVSCTLTCRSC